MLLRTICYLFAMHELVDICGPFIIRKDSWRHAGENVYDKTALFISNPFGATIMLGVAHHIENNQAYVPHLLAMFCVHFAVRMAIGLRAHPTSGFTLSF